MAPAVETLGERPPNVPVGTKQKVLPPADDSLAGKVAELKKAIGPLTGKAKIFCTDDCYKRYLRARGGNVKKAEKMLRDTLEWREKYKPEDIRWEHVAKEGETGKIYRTNFHDKKGRSVLIMCPGKQNTSNHESQIKHLVYCLENAVHTSAPGQEKIVWLIDFRGWTMKKNPPMKTSMETLNILQNHYPERLGAAICYDPPKLFQAFWTMIRPFIDPITYEKIRFIYSDQKDATKYLEEHFNLDTLEKSFGGRSTWEFDIQKYSALMEADDASLAAKWTHAA